MSAFPMPGHRTMAQVLRDEMGGGLPAQQTLAEDRLTAASARASLQELGCEAQAPEGSSGAPAGKGYSPANACEARATLIWCRCGGQRGGMVPATFGLDCIERDCPLRADQVRQQLRSAARSAS